MAPSRSETLRDLFRPLPWALPAALLVTASGLASAGVPALAAVLLVTGWASVVAAFARRLDCILDFPAPDAELRAAIWRACLAEAEVARVTRLYVLEKLDKKYH